MAPSSDIGGGPGIMLVGNKSAHSETAKGFLSFFWERGIGWATYNDFVAKKECQPEFVAT